MPYKFIEHTADIRMKVWGNDLKDLFKDGMMGVIDFLAGKNPKTYGEVKRIINISSVDTTSLLIDFLNEVLTNAQIYKEVYKDLIFNNFSEENNFLEVELRGGVVDKFNKDIKAITYHEANIIKNDKGEFETIIVFDI
jgi:SHS2 domain-containing protein